MRDKHEMSARDDRAGGCTEHNLLPHQQLRRNAPQPLNLDRTGVLHVYVVTDPAAVASTVDA